MGKRKGADDSSTRENVNQDFVDFLQELANYEKNVSNNIHKYNAYRKAAATLAKHPTRITSGNEAKSFPGIGDRIAKKIDEFIETGKLEKLEKIRKDDTHVAIQEMTRVMGIGPAKARDLVMEDGIKSIDELRKHPEKLNRQQLIGLQHLEDFEKRILREEVTAMEEYIQVQAKKLDKKYIAQVCGSYRRGTATSGDIDVLLTQKEYTSDQGKQPKLLHNLVNHLKDKGFISDIISSGDSKFAGVCKLEDREYHRRIDVRLIPYDQYYCALLYFTGSDIFNQRMRAHALEQGYTLNEYSLRPFCSDGKPGEPVIITSESDIFDYINYDYKKPEERNL
ncbi:unnamed protein product [Darwinula stevensoni]|uniref:DNA polymerase n=1 Tax=Darwinula stevensoni TaxID=69355 RepID=A0A7R8XCG1_9CRUS|nr:unnamed protein product [Darwinula stevensoni]CAG0887498.1 unnamed protein product [Darwinula stevensoni]